MTTLAFITGNAVKFHNAQLSLEPLGIRLAQVELDVPEIQADNGEPIARVKAEAAFKLYGNQLVVADDTWIIPGLGGFPGPYMKYVNDWFTSEDWLRLTKSLRDRRIILRQILVYQDAEGQQLFSADIEGQLLPNIRGQHKYTHTAITSMDGGEASIAEHIARGVAFTASHTNAWHAFAKWYSEHIL